MTKQKNPINKISIRNDLKLSDILKNKSSTDINTTIKSCVLTKQTVDKKKEYFEQSETKDNKKIGVEYTKLSTYDYDLPEDLIAQLPLEKRDESRLLVFDKNTKQISHNYFKDIKSFLHAGDVLVVNNTRVLPARLMGKKDNGVEVEILLLKRINLTDWEVLLKPAKRVKIDTKIFITQELSCDLLEILDDGNRIVRFIFEGVFEDVLNRVGSMPLPHYIHEKLEDKERYQTVYSKVDGSAAAPTAGLHFTPELIQSLRDIGVIICEVTLDVGLGTFRPCKENDITKHDMHTEHYSLPQVTADIINKAKTEGRRVVAVGTTSVRTLETVAGKFENINRTFQNITAVSIDKDEQYYSRDFEIKKDTKQVLLNEIQTFDNKIKKSYSTSNNSGWIPISADSGDTSIFIYPPYRFKVVDALITNFHLPKSTLIMLVSAFAGYENTMNIYKTAVDEKYRFFSFGDSMFIE